MERERVVAEIEQNHESPKPPIPTICTLSARRKFADRMGLACRAGAGALVLVALVDVPDHARGSVGLLLVAKALPPCQADLAKVLAVALLHVLVQLSFAVKLAIALWTHVRVEEVVDPGVGWGGGGGVR